jgi:hypothetical protein
MPVVNVAFTIKHRGCICQEEMEQGLQDRVPVQGGEWADVVEVVVTLLSRMRLGGKVKGRAAAGVWVAVVVTESDYCLGKDAL